MSKTISEQTAMHYAEMLLFSIFCRKLDSKAIHKGLFIWKGRKDKMPVISFQWVHVYRYLMPFKYSLAPRSPTPFVSTVHFLSHSPRAIWTRDSSLATVIFFVCWFEFLNISLWITNPKKSQGVKILGWEFFNMLVRLRSVPELWFFSGVICVGVNVLCIR